LRVSCFFLHLLITSQCLKWKISHFGPSMLCPILRFTPPIFSYWPKLKKLQRCCLVESLIIHFK
jgi:hypothetical protein